MSYSELVDEYIRRSGLSLSEIANRMNERGIKIDRSYLSKLRNNPKYPASDEVNRLLAEVTGGDPDKLAFAGYVEKAPAEARKVLEHFFQHIDNYAKMVAFFFANQDQEDDELFQEMDSIYGKINTLPFEKKFDFVLHYFNRMAAARKDIFQDFGNVWGVPQKGIDHSIDSYTKLPLIRTKVVDLLHDTVDYEWTPAEKLTHGEYIYIITNDDSMSGSNIGKGSKILCKLIEKEEDGSKSDGSIESGKIYAVIHQDHMLIRRVFLDEQQAITLSADHPKYPPIFIRPQDDSFSVLAKVVSVEFDPNGND
ncbi:transcriptional regulator with XRE-family HTH domain [Croceifilum oryzae]|uniref:Transcriptional regulator with XRE-family HTH domain n=1 Tax=Croceifilum oryzae TaxID=1553429 RepID=A0AAJ1TFJ1_9BACL|nr:S24 family peptidase [Croceifilum oryzae]MDQ0417569.1 transcriptional regulator with XRE-family HTH domain [Croceifilum oryzae]